MDKMGPPLDRKCSQHVVEKGVCIFFVKDDPSCDDIIEEMLRHRAQEVLDFGDISHVVNSIGMAKDKIELVVTNAHRNGLAIVQLIESKFNLPTMLMQPSETQLSSSCLDLRSSLSIAVILYGLSQNDFISLWTCGLNKVKEKIAVANQEDGIQRHTVAHAAGEQYKIEDVKERGGTAACAKGHSRKKRVEWTSELHSKFLKACCQLGPEYAVPKRILEVIRVPGLTREQIASHLQKYRNSMKSLGSGTDQLSFSSSNNMEDLEAQCVFWSSEGMYSATETRLTLPDSELPTGISSMPKMGFFSTSQYHEKTLLTPVQETLSVFTGYMLTNDQTAVQLVKLDSNRQQASLSDGDPILHPVSLSGSRSSDSAVGMEILHGNSEMQNPLKEDDFTVGSMSVWDEFQGDDDLSLLFHGASERVHSAALLPVKFQYLDDLQRHQSDLGVAQDVEWAFDFNVNDFSFH